MGISLKVVMSVSFKLFEEPFISGIEVHDDLALVVPLCDCNFACPQCHVKNIMNKCVIEYTVDEFADMLVRDRCMDLTICFTGGEPLLYDDELDDMQEFIIDHDLKVVIETNGFHYRQLPTVKYWYVDVKMPLKLCEPYGYIGVDITFSDYYTSLHKYAKAFPHNTFFRLTLIDNVFDNPRVISDTITTIKKNFGDLVIINQGNVSDDRLVDVIDVIDDDVLVFSKKEGWLK